MILDSTMGSFAKGGQLVLNYCLGYLWVDKMKSEPQLKVIN